jgi:two-component system response regulator NreC
MNKLRILIAEDHQTVREGFKLIINQQEDMVVVGEASDGRSAIELARQLQPDIVLMDISMPELNGLLASAKLKRTVPDIKILTLTRHTDEAYLHELLKAGVSGYILKQSSHTELICAIRAVGSGNSYLDSAMTSKVFDGLAGKRNKLRGEKSGEQLTGRESEVIRHVALGYSQQEIADKMDISVKTVEAHKANSLTKLNMRSRKDIVRYAILQGWMREN